MMPIVRHMTSSLGLRKFQAAKIFVEHRVLTYFNNA